MKRAGLRIALRWTAVLAGVGLAALAMLLLYGIALVDRAMAQVALPLSPPVFAAPLALVDGDDWTLEALRSALALRGMQERATGPRAAHEVTIAGTTLHLGSGACSHPGSEITIELRPEGMRLRDERGEHLARAELRPSVIGVRLEHDTVRWPVPLERVSPHLITAVVDIEDRGFLSHAGLSLRGLLRAAARDLAAGGVREGGSTITQQLAKQLMLRPHRTVSRKILEAWLAALLEYRYGKRAILEAYLNRVYFGQDGAVQIQGAEAAAQYVFGTRAADLRLEQAALLAAMIAAPNRFDPFAHPDEATARRRLVLAAMEREGHLTPEQATHLASTPLPRSPRPLRWPPAAHLVERAVAGGRPGASATPTSLEMDVQAAVHAGSAAALARLEAGSATLRRLRQQGDPLQLAVVVLAPDGRVIGLQGSRAPRAGELNRAVAARRQVGSLVKPWVLAAALGAGYGLDSIVDDAPVTVRVGRATWSPENSDGRFRGAVTLRDALTSSLNAPFVRVGDAIGLEAVTALLGRLGFDPPAAPSILLGAFEATPLQVARAYASLVAAGVLPAVSYTAPADGQRVLDSETNRMVLGALEEVPRRGTAAVLAGSVRGLLAAKTGTTQDRRDSWFVGLRPRLVTVVWLGTDGNRETGLLGATGALAVWREIDVRLPEVWRSGRF